MVENIVVVTILLLLFLGMRRIMDGKISARLQYALWLLVGLRLLLGGLSLPGSYMSVMNLFPVMQETVQNWDYRGSGKQGREWDPISGQDSAASQGKKAAWQEGSLPQAEGGRLSDEGIRQKGEVAQGNETQKQADVQAGKEGQNGVGSLGKGISMATLTWPRLIFLLYCVGAAVVLFWIVGKNLWFWHGICKRRILYEGALPDVPIPGRLFLLEQLESPFLFGKNIYVSPEMVCDESGLYHILVHETSHWKQGDLFWSLVRNLCLVMYWYHPLVWVAAHLSVVDEELACDERAIHVLGDGHRLEYGETLLGFLRKQSDLLHCIGISTQMSGSKRETKKRLERIAIKKKQTVGRVLFLVVSMLVLCLFTLPGNKVKTVTDREIWWERAEQEGYPCIVLDEQGNVTGTRRGELLTKVCLDSYEMPWKVGISPQPYQIQANAFAECRNLKTLILLHPMIYSENEYIESINYIDADAFRGCPEDLTVYCEKGCYAWERLQELGLRVKEYRETKNGWPRWLTLGEDEAALKRIMEKANPEHDDTLQIYKLTDQELLQFGGEPCFWMTGSGQQLQQMNSTMCDWAHRKLCIPTDARGFAGTFAQCGEMDLSLTIPKNIVEIGDDSFLTCQIKEVRFEEGSGLQKIGDRAFMDGVKGEVQLPEGVLEIGKSAFEMCGDLKEITIPKSVRILGARCFIGCNSLERVEILNPDITLELEDEIFDRELLNEDLEAVPNEKLHIVCHRGSNAEKYAREHHLQVEYLPSGK